MERMDEQPQTRFERLERKLEISDQRMIAIRNLVRSGIKMVYKQGQRTDERINALIDGQQRSDQRFEERINALIDAQMRAEHRMDQAEHRMEQADQRMQQWADRFHQGMDELRAAQRQTEQTLEQFIRSLKSRNGH